MVDRHGRPIFVGWAEHELLWLKAALTLGRDDRTAAFQDIAAITGRTEFAVRDKAKAIRAERREWALSETSRRIMVVPRRQVSVPMVMPSQLRQPTKAQLMGCR